MDRFFNAERVAVIGASPRPANVGRIIVQNMINWGYKGEIYPVNPGGEPVMNVPAYPDPESLPNQPDLAVLMLPASRVPEMVSRCGRLGITRCAIPSGGFDETGGAGADLSQRLRVAARQARIRFLGPNGLMAINAANGLAIPFYPLPRIDQGSVSLIVQSGGIGLSLLTAISTQSLGLAKFVSLGNKLDLDEVDALRYLAADDETRIILMLLEDVRRGRELVEAISACEKPVVILKSNRGEASAKAAMSHTAALANDDAVVRSLLSQAGARLVDELEQLVDSAKAINLGRWRGDRLLIASPSGGHAVMAADAAAKYHFPFADLSPSFNAFASSILRTGIIRLNNPLDTGTVYDPVATGEILARAIEDEEVDAALIVLLRTEEPPGELSDTPLARLNRGDVAGRIHRAAVKTGKPVAVVVHSWPEHLAELRRRFSGWPLFASVDQACSQLNWLRSLAESTRPPVNPAPSTQREVRPIAPQTPVDHPPIVGEDALAIIEGVGIPIPAQFSVARVPELSAIRERLHFPAVAKASHPSIDHKTEAGGVRLNITDHGELERHVQELLALAPGATVIIQPEIKGVEIILGARCDPAFGPIITIGTGGIAAELWKDVQILLAPVQSDAVRAAIRGLRGAALLDGWRGQPQPDIDLLVDCAIRLGALIVARPDIKEIDVNPLILDSCGQGGYAVDARIYMISERADP